MSDKVNPLAWREATAVADMHCRLAAKKLNVLMTKDNLDHDRMLSELRKAIECIEAAHEAAMRSYNDLVVLTRRAKSVRGVRLTSIRETAKPLTASIGDLSDNK
jgi:hypothetical protein